MNILLTGIILLIVFTMAIILLVSSSYNYMEKEAKRNQKNNTLKPASDDAIFNFIKHLSESISKKISQNKELITDRNNFMKVFKLIYTFFIKIFLLVINFIILVFEKIKPIKSNHTQINYNPEEEIEEDILTSKILDTPNVIIREGTKRVKSLRQIQKDKEITSEEFAKLESALLHKIDTSMSDDKFDIALELANLYGRVGNKTEQKEICKWILEKGNHNQQQIASRMIIGM